MAVTWNNVTNGQAIGTNGTWRDTSPNVIGGKSYVVGNDGFLHEHGWENKVNVAATAGAAANAYRNAAEGSLEQAQGTLNTAFGNLQGYNAGLRTALDGIISGDAGIDGYLKQATENYGKIN